MDNALGYLGLAFQSDEGTSAAPIKYVPWQQLAMPETIRMGTYHNGYNRDLSIAAKLAQFSEITFKTFLYPDTGAFLIAEALASIDALTGGSDPYTHTMPMNDRKLKFLSVEGSLANGGMFQRVPDCLIDKLTINLVGGALVELDVSIKGRQVVRQASGASVSFESDRPLSFLDSVLTLTGLDISSNDVTELKIEIENGVKGYFPVGAFAPRYLAEGRQIIYTGKSLWNDDAAIREINWGSSTGTTAVSKVSYLSQLQLVFDLNLALEAIPDHQISLNAHNVEMEMANPNWDVNAAATLLDIRGKVIRNGTPANMLTATAMNAYGTAYSS